MTASFSGQGAAFSVVVAGRSVLGIETEEDLAVNTDSNLLADDAFDLAVVEGVRWVGLSAAQTIEFDGGTANNPSETQP